MDAKAARHQFSHACVEWWHRIDVSMQRGRPVSSDIGVPVRVSEPSAGDEIQDTDVAS